MNWNKGFTASFYAYLIDPTTWRETSRLQITGGTINRSDGGLRQSADIDCVRYNGGEQWIRVYMDTEQNGASAHVPLFTGLATSPAQVWDGYYETESLECYSVLKPADDVLLDRGYYVPSNIGADLILRSLLSVCPAPIIVTGIAPRLQTAIIAENGETRLTMTERVLASINWRLRIHGDGTIEIASKATEEVSSFDPNSNDVIEPSIKVDRDWYSCPNVVRAVSGDITAIAKDDSEGLLSIKGRGREIWHEDSSVTLNSGESIAQYARRRLKELQSVSQTASYTRRFDPVVNVGDIIRLNYPKQRLSGLYEVTEQKIQIAYGASTEEGVKTYER